MKTTINERITKKQVKAAIDGDLKSLLEVMLKKAELTESDIVESSLRSWIATNLDLLTKTERDRFKHLFLRP